MPRSSTRLPLLLFALSLPLLAQTTNPAYLAGLPSVDKVKTLQGKDPVDTIARQVAVFNYLPAIIDRMANGPGRKYGERTPDEIKYSAMYGGAGYQMTQAFPKSHTPEETKLFDQLHNRYEVMNALQDALSISSPAFVEEYGKFDRRALADFRAHMEKERKDNETPPASAAAGQPGGMRNDAGSREVRRCLELGGNEMECMGKGLKTGFFDLVGINPDALIPSTTPSGLRMTGIYQGAGSLSLTFADDGVALNGCGQLVVDSHNYSVAKRGDQLLITLNTQPKPLLVTLGPDGKLVGPSAADIAGQIIVGYRHIWVEKRRVSDNTVVPGSGHEESVPIFAPKTEHCAIGSFRPSGPTGTASGAIKMVMTTLTEGKSLEKSAQEAARDLPPPGPRMFGKYASQGGFQLDFNSLGAVMECGEAHIMKPYAVQNSADRIVITVQAAPPLNITLLPNGSLTGPASVDVNGRIVTGTNANGVTYAPRNASCTAGTLVSRNGQVQ